MHKDHLPADFAPFHQLDVCGNSFVGGTIPLEVAEHVPILIGQPKGQRTDAPPRVWLAVPVGTRKWVTVVIDGRVAPGKPFARFSVEMAKDANGISIVAGKINILTVRTVEKNRAELSSLDLRPIGLNIFGNSSTGLQVSNTIFKNNSFPNVHTMVRTKL